MSIDMRREIILAMRRSRNGKECQISGSAFPFFSVMSVPLAGGGREEKPLREMEVDAFLKSLPFRVKYSCSYSENKIYLEVA